jgi:hypothetical protein
LHPFRNIGWREWLIGVPAALLILFLAGFTIHVLSPHGTPTPLGSFVTSAEISSDTLTATWEMGQAPRGVFVVQGTLPEGPIVAHQGCPCWRSSHSVAAEQLFLSGIPFPILWEARVEGWYEDRSAAKRAELRSADGAAWGGGKDCTEGELIVRPISNDVVQKLSTGIAFVVVDFGLGNFVSFQIIDGKFDNAL